MAIAKNPEHAMLMAAQDLATAVHTLARLPYVKFFAKHATYDGLAKSPMDPFSEGLLERLTREAFKEMDAERIITSKVRAKVAFAIEQAERDLREARGGQM